MRLDPTVTAMDLTFESSQFSPDVEAMLLRHGWTIAEAPAGLTLGALRTMGAPFRGTRFFREFAPDVFETPSVATALAYQPGFLPGSLNQLYPEASKLVEEFDRTAPSGTRAIIASAATYVWLLWQHAQRTGTFPLTGYYTWTADTSPEGQLIVGVFGRDRPLVVAPHAKTGAGVGVMPILLPSVSARTPTLGD